jgi:hypothetical protein
VVSTALQVSHTRSMCSSYRMTPPHAVHGSVALIPIALSLSVKYTPRLICRCLVCSQLSRGTKIRSVTKRPAWLKTRFWRSLSVFNGVLCSLSFLRSQLRHKDLKDRDPVFVSRAFSRVKRIPQLMQCLLLFLGRPLGMRGYARERYI